MNPLPPSTRASDLLMDLGAIVSDCHDGGLSRSSNAPSFIA